MRTFLIAVLLAGGAAPALAARPTDDDHGEPRHERSKDSETSDSAPKEERSAERPQQHSAELPQQGNVERRGENPGGSEGLVRQGSAGHARASDSGNVQAVEQAHHRDAGNAVRERRQQQAVETDASAPQRSFEPREVRPPRNSSEGVRAEHSGDTVRNWRSRERNGEGGGSSIEERNLRRAPVDSSGGDLVQSRHPVPRVLERGEGRISRTPRFGTEPPAPRTATAIAAKPTRHWRTDWRHDHRYNWHDYRRHHRSHFHIGLYYDPFGWDYMQYGIGWRLWPSYYRSSFWLNDPWQYRLPPAYGPYRWVRYFNDALLVNIYTGEVADVEYNFFW